MKSYPVKKNYIGSAVRDPSVQTYKHTDKQTDNLLLYEKDIRYTNEHKFTETLHCVTGAKFTCNCVRFWVHLSNSWVSDDCTKIYLQKGYLKTSIFWKMRVKCSSR